MPIRWYLTAAATRDYLRLAGLPDDDGGPAWARAERELAEHCAAARDTGRRSRSGAQCWRTGRRRVGDRQRAVRLEMTVSTTPRPEGPLPQLLRVRDLG